MLRKLGHIILFLCFLLYSQSIVVMWCLYFIEKHDIVLYYEVAEDTSNGLRFMQKICDAHRGEHNGALSLIKVVERTPPYLLVQKLDLSIAHREVIPIIEQEPLPIDDKVGCSVFHPPRA